MINKRHNNYLWSGIPQSKYQGYVAESLNERYRHNIDIVKLEIGNKVNRKL